MPKFNEWAEVEAGGQIYRDWTAVSVTRGLSNLGCSVATLALVEPTSGSGASFANMKLKPGDKVTVTLAGNRVFKGYVVDRQAVYDAQNHGVQIVAKAEYQRIIESNVPLKGGEFRDYKFDAIAKKILEPFNMQLKVENAPKDFDKKFKEVNVLPGDTAYSFLERLARMRNIRLRSGEDGDVIAGNAKEGGSTVADLQEGKNIVAASIRITDDGQFTKAGIGGQQRGDDQTNDETARKPAAFVPGGNGDYKLLVVLPEMPGDKDDMRIRTDRQAAEFSGAMIYALVTVQGWLKPGGGGIWKEFETIKLVSPMGLMNHELDVKDVTFIQDEAGTKTILNLVKKGTLGTITTPGVSAGDGGVLPGGPQGAAQPEA